MNNPMATEPDNTPRYQLESEQDVKILSQEQSRCIQKLLGSSGHVLTGEERELVLQLVTKLDQETERVQSLRNMTVADKTLESFLVEDKPGTAKLGAGKSTASGTSSDGEEPEAEEDSQEEPVIRHVVGFKPEEVVQRYIECWNQQKFRAEFECFSDDFMMIPMEQYIEARQNSYQQEMQRGGQRVEFAGIESSEVIGGEADVVASKTITQGQKQPKTETDRYRLKLESGRWVIYAVEPS